MRVPAEDRRQVQTEINGRRYTARSGFFDMPESDAKAHMKSAGYGTSWNAAHGATGAPTVGYRCTLCGFGSFFKRCSRCAADTCIKENTDAPTAAGA